MSRLAGVALAGALLAGYGGGARVAAERPGDVDWRRLATSADRTRLRGWRQAWVEALAAVRATTAGTAALAREPQLFDPDRTLGRAVLPLGAYRCRTARLAPRDPAMRPIAITAWVPCAVTSDGTAPLLVVTGEQRVQGHLFVDTDARGIFLGTLALGDERRAMRYGRDPRRDMAGIVERIDERRWRLVLPYPAFGTTIDVIEIARG